MTSLQEIREGNASLSDWCIMLAYRGSIAHGMYIPNSDPNSIDDIDLMGICIPPVENYLGLKRFGSRGTQEIKVDEWDIVVYEVQKAVSLLAVGNPNILGMLWLDEYVSLSTEGQMLVDNRELFSTKRVYHAFTGYAHGQLKRMTHFAFEGYMGEKRKQIVERHGYDTKNAAHLVRLLRMGIEFMESGKMNVNRSGIDADELLDIKRGKWSLEEVKLESERLFALSKEARDKSRLPEYPSSDKVNKLCVDMITHRLFQGE